MNAPTSRQALRVRLRAAVSRLSVIEAMAERAVRHPVTITFWVVLLATSIAVGVARAPGGTERRSRSSQPRTTISDTATPTEPVPSADPDVSTVAEAAIPEVRIFDHPGDPRPSRRLENPTEVGAPLVFLVEHLGERWLKVLLPVRPNGTTGWIRRDDVTLSHHDYRIEVFLRRHRLRVFKGSEVIMPARIAVGRRDAPTPGGRYYIKELLKPPTPDSIYGPYAYGLSGFSNDLPNFAGGEGVIGIHGTNDPSSIGRDVSSGCIRLRNRDIRKLVRFLPLGTPVEIFE